MKHRCPLFFWLLAVCYLISGCATTEEIPTRPLLVPKQGVYHKVYQGETIWRIAKMYDIAVDEIIRSNNIPNVAHIEKDQLLFIPGARSVRTDISIDKTTGKSGDFDWPLRGKIISYFGDQSDLMSSNGIDIQTEEGEKVLAARSGQVVFADYLNGYGHTVILDHADDFFTVYSQNSALLVKLDDAVSKGSPIALAGSNGGSSYVHFEIRRGFASTNPLYYLP